MFSEPTEAAPAIRVAGLSKAYQIYAKPSDRLRQAVIPRLARPLAPLRRLLGLREPAYFTEFQALKGLSFDVKRGETVGIIGRNGSGKSTLLQLVCGTLTPSSGTVSVRGRLGALLELGSGFNPEYTGRENVFLNASVLGLSQEQIEARLEGILAFADIGEHIDQPVKAYSSGMAMRLAFAVIAHIDADVLIIDEALAVGDAYFQQKCFRWLRDFQARGTVLFCGHDIGAIMSLCNRAIWLDRGSVRLEGPAKEVAEAYSAFVAAAGMGLPENAVQVGLAASDAVIAAPGEVTVEASALARQPALGSTSYGTSNAEILDVRFMTPSGVPLSVLNAGQDVILQVRAKARTPLEGVILGFHLKDRLGQPILVDNTFRSFLRDPVDAAVGQVITARFRFLMPALLSGKYTLNAAIATGTQDSHIQHHFLHDAAVVEVHSPLNLGAVLAVPMQEITLAVGAS